MSIYTSGLFRSTKNVGGDSIFKVPIGNHLGLEKQNSYNLLKVVALQKPIDYAKDRQKLFENVVTKAVESNYNLVWSVLAEGLDPEDATGKTPIIMCGTEFNPRLPAIEIGDISNDLAKLVMQAWEDIFEKILPDSFTKIADEKLKQSTVIPS